MVILRLKLPRAWTAEEDERLTRLAKENRFRHWHRVAREMPGRSHGLCRDRWRNHLARDVYHRAFTAGDDAELVRLHRCHGGRWKDIRRAIPGRTTRVLKRRWKELRKNAKNGDKKTHCTPPVPAEDSEPSSPLLQHPHADVLAAGFSSFSLGCVPMDPWAGSLVLGFATMTV